MALARTDKEGYLRDTSTRAVLNADLAALDAYKKQRKKAREFEELKSKVEIVETHNERLDVIEHDLDLIKSALSQILEKLNANSRS